MLKSFKYFLFTFLLSLSFLSLSANETTDPKDSEKVDIAGQIFGHIGDAHEWHIFTIGDFHGTIPLPVIIYNPERGFSMFSSSKFEHGHASYDGYQLNEEGKVVSLDGSKIYDISLTKNVTAMLLAVVFILIFFISIKKSYQKKGSGKAPSGIQNAIEAAILFVRDDVAKPNIGSSYMKFVPFLLSLFFFIWIVNLLGLIPGGANVTGNIAVTACLAFVTFIVMLFTSKKGYWAHMFNPPGLPLPVKILLVPIEMISLVIKPVALTVRLFANILAGHIVILSFVLLIFVFAELNVAVGASFSIMSVALSVFILLIKLLVAAIQAFIFSNLAAVFIGAMVEDDAHEEENPIAALDHVVNKEEISM